MVLDTLGSIKTTLSSSGRQGTFRPLSSLCFTLIRIQLIYENFLWIKADFNFKSSWKIETHFLISRQECLEARGKHWGAVADLTNWGPEANIFMGPSTSAVRRFNLEVFSTIFKYWKLERTRSHCVCAIFILLRSLLCSNQVCYKWTSQTFQSPRLSSFISHYRNKTSITSWINWLWTNSSIQLREIYLDMTHRNENGNLCWIWKKIIKRCERGVCESRLLLTRTTLGGWKVEGDKEKDNDSFRRAHCSGKAKEQQKENGALLYYTAHLKRQ